MNHFAIYPSLADRTVFITGGATGIGASLVEHFVEQGSKVAFIDIAVEAGRALATRLAAGARHVPLFLVADLTDIAALRGSIRDARVSYCSNRACIAGRCSCRSRLRWSNAIAVASRVRTMASSVSSM